VPQRRAKGEGTVYHEPARNRWVAAVEIDGKRRKVTASTKTEARTRLNDLLRKRDRGESVNNGNLTVAHLLDSWETRALAAKTIAPSTSATFAWSAEHIRNALGSRRLRNLTVDDVEAAFDLLSADGLGRSSLVKIRSTLSQALDFGVRRGYVVKNVAKETKIGADAGRSRSRSSLGHSEFLRFLEILAAERLGALFALSVTVGLRPGEAAGLRWKAIDLERRTVTVASALRLENGRAVVVDSLKTPKAYRTIKIPAVVCELIQIHSQRQQVERESAEIWADSTLVFTTRVGSPLNPSNLRRELQRILAAADLPSVTPNELRHTAASLLSDAAVPLEQVADLLGHTSTRMLDQTYRHRLRPSIDAAAQVVDVLLEGKQ
jgi:integrase